MHTRSYARRRPNAFTAFDCYGAAAAAVPRSYHVSCYRSNRAVGTRSPAGGPAGAPRRASAGTAAARPSEVLREAALGRAAGAVTLQAAGTRAAEPGERAAHRRAHAGLQGGA